MRIEAVKLAHARGKHACRRRLLPLVLIVLGLSGCAVVPSEGPSTADVLKETAQGLQRYEIVTLDMRVAQVLGRRSADKSIASFGDYRPSTQLRIGIGDEISVTIWEAAAGGLFSAPLVSDRFTTGSKSSTIPTQIVDRDGTITIPYAGAIHVAGRTPPEVQREIETALAGKAIQPQVLVNMTRSIGNTATVLGEVVTGARVPISVKGDRVLDVIAEAGGVKAPVNETFIELSRGDRSARVAMSRVVSDHREDIFVRPGDVLTVIRDPQTFIAYGATGRNAEIPFDADGINLNQALAKAGGILDSRADPTGVFVFRFEPESIASQLRPGSPLVQPGRLTPFVYQLDLRDPNSLFVAQQFPVFNRDILYVSNATLTDVQKVMEIFNLAITPSASAATVYSVVK